MNPIEDNNAVKAAFDATLSIVERTVQEIADAQVQFGVAVLNHKFPDWLDRIDTDNLDMSLIRRCVLGQVLAGMPEGGDLRFWPDVVRSVFGDASHTPDGLVVQRYGTGRWAVESLAGFDMVLTGSESRLRAAWVAEIERLRGLQASSEPVRDAA